VKKLKREFPFKKTLESIQEQCSKRLSRQGCDDHEELMVTLGAILCSGDQKVQALAEELLRNGSQGIEEPQRRKDSLSFVFPKAQPNPSATASGKDISALKELGDRIGEIPQYKAVSVNDYPPCFEVVLRFRGSKFIGRGGSKPKAKQEAAFKACREFAELMEG